MLRAVATVDVLDDLLAPGGTEVDIDIRIRRPALVDEPFEQEVVADRLDPGDAQYVGHDGARRAAPALSRDALLLREAHEIPADQEELGQARPLDDVQFMGELADHGRRDWVIAPPGTDLTQLDEVAEGRLPVRDREPREAVPLETKVHRTRRRQLHRSRDARRPDPRRPWICDREARLARRQHRQLRAGLQVRLAVRAPQVPECFERSAVPDGGQDIGQFTVFGAGVVDIVGDDDRQPGRLGQRGRLGYEPVIVRQEVVRQLDEEAARGGAVTSAEERRIPFRDGPRPGPVAGSQPTGEFPITAAGQRDQAFRVLGEERLAEPRDPLRADHIGPRHQPAQAPPTDARAGEQDKMRPAHPLADAAQVLLDRVAMPGQPSA